MPQSVAHQPRRLSLLLLVTLALLTPEVRAADPQTVVRFSTPYGSFDVELFPDEAPLTVANFLKYVSDGDYEGSFLHRSIPSFVLQGGGFTFVDGVPVAIPVDAAVRNEPGRTNARGTIAMAKMDGNPNSATSQWFFNLIDNGSTLDAQNGGFTVFGQVLGDGMAVVDAIAAAPTFNAGSPFDNIPLRDYTVGDAIAVENLFTVSIVDMSASRAPTVLLRSTKKGTWQSYRLTFDNEKVKFEEKGSAGLTRSSAFSTASRADFDGDGLPDVLLRGSEGARAATSWTLATLEGKKITAEETVALPTGDEWELVATEDVDGDGNADALFRNTDDGTWMVFLLEGTTIKASAELDLSDDLDDEFIGTGDFNGDGRWDVLLRRGNGTWLAYLLDGTSKPKSGRPKLPKSSRSGVVAIADFDGDGNADALVRTDDGTWDFYGMNGTKVAAKGTVAMNTDLSFTLAAEADFDGDGNADALLQGSDGSWYLYSLDGSDILNEGPLAMDDDPTQTVVSTDDFNADGKADALLRSAAGTWKLYNLDGSGPTILGSTTPKLKKGKDWVPQID